MYFRLICFFGAWGLVRVCLRLRLFVGVEVLWGLLMWFNVVVGFLFVICDEICFGMLSGFFCCLRGLFWWFWWFADWLVDLATLCVLFCFVFLFVFVLFFGVCLFVWFWLFL